MSGECSGLGNCQFSERFFRVDSWSHHLPFCMPLLIVCPRFLLRTCPHPHVMLETMDSNRTSISNDFQDQENQGVLRHVELLRSRRGVLRGGGEQKKKNVSIKYLSAHCYLGPSCWFGRRFLSDFLSRQEFLSEHGWPSCGGTKGNMWK